MYRKDYYTVSNSVKLATDDMKNDTSLSGDDLRIVLKFREALLTRLLECFTRDNDNFDSDKFLDLMSKPVKLREKK